MKKVLITGATGFIGGHLVEANLQKGNSVRALVLEDDPESGFLEEKEVETVVGDIRDFNSVARAVKGMDIIFHCAAVVTDWAPADLFKEVTVGGTENICRAALAEGVDRFVDISTNDVFGTDESLIMDESTPLSPWGEPYSDSKIEAEKITWQYADKGLPTSMVYPCWVYGEGDRTFVPLLADAIVKRDLIFWHRDVLVWPTYILNLIDLLMFISEDERAIGQGYLVHDGLSVTLQRFCEEIANALDVPPIKTHIPYWAAMGAAVLMEKIWKLLDKKQRPLLTTYTVKNLGSRFNFSIKKARDELNWEPEITYAEGMARTLAWLKTLEIKDLKQK